MLSALVCLNHVTGTYARGSALVQTRGSIRVVLSTAVEITVFSSRYVTSPWIWGEGHVVFHCKGANCFEQVLFPPECSSRGGDI